MDNKVNYVTTENVIAPAGITLATFVGQNANEVQKWIQVVSGATPLIFGTATGSTVAGATLAAAAYGSPWIVPTTGLFDLKGPAKFYLGGASATMVIQVIRGYNSPSAF